MVTLETITKDMVTPEVWLVIVQVREDKIESERKMGVVRDVINKLTRRVGAIELSLAKLEESPSVQTDKSCQDGLDMLRGLFNKK